MKKMKSIPSSGSLTAKNYPNLTSTSSTAHNRSVEISITCIPIIEDNKVIGVLSLISRSIWSCPPVVFKVMEGLCPYIYKSILCCNNFEASKERINSLENEINSFEKTLQDANRETQNVYQQMLQRRDVDFISKSGFLVHLVIPCERVNLYFPSKDSASGGRRTWLCRNYSEEITIKPDESACVNTCAVKKDIIHYNGFSSSTTGTTISSNKKNNSMYFENKVYKYVYMLNKYIYVYIYTYIFLYIAFIWSKKFDLCSLDQ